MFLPQKRRQQVQRGGQPADRPKVALRAVGTEKVERPGALETIVRARAAAEIQEVGAAAQGHVLAGVEQAPGAGIDERAGPAAEVRGLLEKFHLAAVLGQGCRGADAGQAAADDGHAY